MSGMFLFAYICWGLSVVFGIISIILYKKLSIKQAQKEMRAFAKKRRRPANEKGLGRSRRDELIGIKEKNIKNGKFEIIRKEMVTHSSVSLWKNAVFLLVLTGGLFIFGMYAYAFAGMTLTVEKEEYWVNAASASVNIKGKVQGNGSESAGIAVSQESVEAPEDLPLVASVSDNGAFSFFYDAEGIEGSKKLYIYAISTDGAFIEKEITLKADFEGPYAELAEAMGIMKFGRIFFGTESRYLKLAITDELSGPARAALYSDAVLIEEKQVTGGSVSFYIPSGFEAGLLKLELTDKAGNKTVFLPWNEKLYLDEREPVITFLGSEGLYESEGVSYYREAPQLYYCVSENAADENESGLAFCRIEADGEQIGNYSETASENAVYLASVSANLPESLCDGKCCEIEVIAGDNAGNTSNCGFKLCLDREMPEIALTAGQVGVIGGDSLELEFTAIDSLSGISKIEYFTKTENTTSPIEEVSGDSLFITLEAPFKGHVYVKAYDNVGNESPWQDAGEIVLENETLFRQNTELSVSLPETECITSRGTLMYSGDVEIALSAENSYAGIREMKWELKCGEEVVESGSSNAGFSEMLYVSMEKPELVLTVTAIGKSGYSLSRTYNFGIDKTLPKIQLSYEEYQNQPARVDLEITDENMLLSGIALLINGERHENIFEKNDAGQWTGVLDLEAEGQYFVSLSATDEAGNTSREEALITLDMTAPEIQVTFSEDLSSGFSNKTVTGLICVTEENFSPENSFITKNGLPLEGISWLSVGDKNTAVVTFEADDSNSLIVTVKDKAGNSGKAYTGPSFITDFTLPVIEFEGSENVRITDLNLDTQKSRVYLTGLINTDMADYLEQSEKTLYINGLSEMEMLFSIKELPLEREFDDIYTLRAIGFDKAGNELYGEYTFTVNRFGSAYSAASASQKVNGCFLRTPETITLYESNLSPLSSEIYIIKNEMPRLLNKDEYEILLTEADGRKIYCYTLPSELFNENAVYEIRLTSLDEAGNFNDSAASDFNLKFAIDNENPCIQVPALADGMVINKNALGVTAYISDNLLVQEVTISLNGQDILFDETEHGYFFEIGESSDYQSVEIKAVDGAGNECVYTCGQILISSNTLVRWFKNKDLFAGSLIDILSVLAYGGYKIIYALKK